MDVLASFPREFSSLFRVSRGRFVLLRLLSCGDLKLLRDVTGKALLSSALQSLNSLLRDVMALARS